MDTDRIHGTMLGQMVGDALGTTCEFASAAAIAERYPDGLREIVGGGPFRLLPGQITDDTELALALARALVACGRYDADAVARAYVAWRNSDPFDIGGTTAAAFPSIYDLVEPSEAVVSRDVLLGRVTARLVRHRARYASGDPRRQANGSLMRCSPLGIFGARLDDEALAELARTDSDLSHPSPACRESCAAYVVAVAHGIRGATRAEMFEVACAMADAPDGREHGVLDALRQARDEPMPACDAPGQGWVLRALRVAFHQLLHAESFEEALVEVVRAGGDADTNGAIAGALLGSAVGASQIPARWRETVLACRTDRGATYQTGDAVELADALAAASGGEVPLLR